MKKAGLFIPENYKCDFLEQIRAIKELELVDIHRFDEIDRIDKISDFMNEQADCVFVIDPTCVMQEIILSSIRNRKHVYLFHWELYDLEFLKKISDLSAEAEILLHLNQSSKTFFYKSFLSIYLNISDIIDLFIEKNTKEGKNISLFTELLSIYLALGRKLKKGTAYVIEDDSGIKVYKSIWYLENDLVIDIGLRFNEIEQIEIRSNTRDFRLNYKTDIEINEFGNNKIVLANDFLDTYSNYFKNQVRTFLKNFDQIILSDGELFETLYFIESLKKINVNRLNS